jgi:hypothetical protein
MTNAEPASGVLNQPETHVATFAFLLNFPWEFLQVPFFAGMATAPHWEAIQFCTRASLGDAGIALAAFWAVAVAVRSRRWIRYPRIPDVLGFVGIGVAITIVFEWLATGVLGRWAYADTMPVVPLLGVGLLPLVQWTVLPPLIVWFTRRQLRGA